MKLPALFNRRGPTLTPCGTKHAFTLLELAVVIATIAILSYLSLPALAKAKPESQAVRCLNNIRQLGLAANTYADDFNGIWAPNEPGQTCWINLNMDWNLGNTDNTNINKLMDPNYSKLVKYIGSDPGIFHCPGDKSSVTVVGPRLRSVSMNQAVGSVWTAGGCLVQNGPVNGQWLTGANIGSGCQTVWRTYGKTTDFVAPGPSLTWVFADEHMDSINDSSMAVECSATGFSGWFVDAPANYHNGAGSFCFADGHAEAHKWVGNTLKNLPSINMGTGGSANGLPVASQSDSADLSWLQQRTSAKY